MPDDGDLLYRQIAHSVTEAVRSGVYRAGERLPSLRQLARSHGVSLSTALQAYETLVDLDIVEPRERSGYFVRPSPAPRMAVPAKSQPTPEPVAVNVGRLALSLMEAARRPGVARLGAAVPGPETLPVGPLSRLLAGTIRRHAPALAVYESTSGNPELRRQIARLMREAGVEAAPDDVIVTNGCLEALTLALRSVTRPGDSIAVESPTYFGILQALQALDLTVVELPTDPTTGIDLGALERVAASGGIRACLLTPSYSNPSGACMPPDRRRRAVEILARAGVPLIEDDIFGFLNFAGQRPPAAKAFDREGIVLTCGSFSKTLAPGLHVGWILPGRYRERVEHLKFLGTISTAGPVQIGLAEFLASGGYARSVRRTARQFEGRMRALRTAVAEHFPEGTRMTDPSGGCFVWVELPDGVDGLEFHNRALTEGVSVTPGALFSPDPARGFRRHIRLSCAAATEDEIAGAVVKLGRLAHAMARQRS